MEYVTLRKLRLGWEVEYGRTTDAGMLIDGYWFLTRRSAQRFERSLVDVMDKEWGL